MGGLGGLAVAATAERGRGGGAMAGARSLPSPMNMAMVVVLRREGGEVNKAAAAGARVHQSSGEP